MRDLSSVCEGLGVEDVFALKQVEHGQLVNLAGYGRGAGWAGNVTVDPSVEPLISEALGSVGMVRAETKDRPAFGPYWSEMVAITAIGDFVVVFGGKGVADLDDDRLLDAAGEITWGVSEVPTDKRLADELEVTAAALSVASLPSDTQEVFLEGLARVAAQALACEFSAVVIGGDPPEVLIADSTWQPSGDVAEVAHALTSFAGAAEDRPLFEQSVEDSAFAVRPLTYADGVVARCAIPLSDTSGAGHLVVAHTDMAPRGFTSLCQRVAGAIGEQANNRLAEIARRREAMAVMG